MQGKMMYAKVKSKKKRRMHHPASVLQQDDGTCYLCVKLNQDCQVHRYLETHHVFGGPNRRISEEYGFKVKLCPEHHRTGREAVHKKIENMRLIQRDAQRVYEKTHTRQQFTSLLGGRNYLVEEEGE